MKGKHRHRGADHADPSDDVGVSFKIVQIKFAVKIRKLRNLPKKQYGKKTDDGVAYAFGFCRMVMVHSDCKIFISTILIIY